MRQLILYGIIIICISCHNSNVKNNISNDSIKFIDSSIIKKEEIYIPKGLQKLKAAYPDFIDSIGKNFIICNDGTKLIYDDGIIKNNYDSLLNYADLDDQMKIVYHKGVNYNIPNKNQDPGRVRNEAFFKKMYGSTKQEVAKNIITINWLPETANKKLKVTQINNVDKHLTAVSMELQQYPELLKYLDNPAGGFYWRNIAGTNRLSMHSFGIAVDINVKYSNYWKWSKDRNSNFIKYKNRIPLKIVEIFEKHGFIWGGKWYHYDTMHFEYRPELL